MPSDPVPRTANLPAENTEPPVGSLADVPNQITVARLVATIACFACLSFGAIAAGLVLFILAAATDWADGYWARRWGPITKLGRVLDPLADKLLICGVFVYLATMPDSDVPPWVAVLVLARELVVTGLRSFVEGAGGDFSAVWLGKAKMAVQCITAGLCLLQSAGLAGMRWPGPWLTWSPQAWTVVDSFVVATVVLTVWSGVTYGIAAWRFATRAEGQH
ncbi:CDP-diacylglycerol--glycerol-3-phosphate 3-phosphatidyltransferase [Botrimarina hoheduenensis]|uniref:CDP-diacylglycerol--glycerol-3-phosphate 3-phosphatidyltransferase n=1 Tax=Botrimarina hoheduenensis TaxID=2528000 RepID=A0A5C5WF58_9BACT|nr:CDP-diacylglycerol--glycerol-3-phosphate 3-phosphatidyltransferase [Botrimarina hoheduenensis]TWT48729.1 CDP-diacylglycerol--glycerol-3-phosphate 3-phosphatidyltransferase [Botrimarina hoheduenensis]